MYRVFIKYCFLSFKCDSSELCQFYRSAGLLPAIKWSKHEVRCTHRGKTERGQSLEYILKSKKKTFNTLYNSCSRIKKLSFIDGVISS